MRWRDLAILVPVLVAAFGCATPETSLNSQLRPALGLADARLMIPQSGIDVTVQPTDGGAGGFLGVLVAAAIDSKREADATKSARPILDALRTFDFRTVMTNAMAQEQANHPRAPVSPPWKVEIIDSDSHRRALFDASTAPTVLFVSVSYRLESGNLIVTAASRMYPKSAELIKLGKGSNSANPIDEGNAIHRKSFSFVKNNLTPQDAERALTEGARSIAAQILGDLERDF